MPAEIAKVFIFSDSEKKSVKSSKHKDLMLSLEMSCVMSLPFVDVQTKTPLHFVLVVKEIKAL